MKNLLLIAAFFLTLPVMFVQATPLVQQQEPVVQTYLALKNALVAGSATEAAKAGQHLSTVLVQLSKEQPYTKLAGGALKIAGQIAKSTDIAAQRKAFKSLSDDVYQLLKTKGVATKLYWDYCPMAKAYWLSDQEPIENPYYGQSMLSCGSVKETLRP